MGRNGNTTLKCSDEHGHKSVVQNGSEGIARGTLMVKGTGLQSGQSPFKSWILLT